MAKPSDRQFFACGHVGQRLLLPGDRVVHAKEFNRQVFRLYFHRLQSTVTPSSRAGSKGVIACVMYAEKIDRKSTRLNSSHVAISYAVFCLKKKRRLLFI